MEKNVFFDVALNQATRLLGNKKRIFLLVTRLGLKLKEVNWRETKGADVKEKFFVVGRLVKAYASGQYRSIPWKSVLLITGAIVYFISPLDLIPDLIPIIGFTDDFGILIAIYESLHSELEKFHSWEKARVIKI